MIDDPILEDIVKAFHSGWMKREPSELSRTSVDQVLADTKFQTREMLRDYLNRKGTNIRRSRIPVRH